MATYYVPFLVIRHAYTTVEADSEGDALAEGWDAAKQSQCRWLFESISVEQPFLKLPEDEFDDIRVPAADLVSLNHVELMPRLTHE